MKNTQKKLGRGLDKLFGADTSKLLDEIQQGGHPNLESGHLELAVDSIRHNPYQPRKEFDMDALNELAESICLHGVFTPILVRKSPQGYELVAGERRLRASQLAKRDTIPAIVVDFNDQQMMEIALIENIQREDLNPIEEAQGYQLLMERLNYSQQELADRMNKSRSYVANLLRLLSLPQDILTMVLDKDLTVGHIRPLVTLDSDHDRIEAAKYMKDHHLSVRQAEAYVKRLKNPRPTTRKFDKVNYKYPKDLLEKKLLTQVDISRHKISIRFKDTSDLNRILESLGVLEDI